MLVMMVLCLSIDPQADRALTQPETARWLPPDWFLALKSNHPGRSGSGTLLSALLLTGLYGGLAFMITAATRPVEWMDEEKPEPAVRGLNLRDEIILRSGHSPNNWRRTVRRWWAARCSKT